MWLSSEQPCSTLAAHRNHRENFKNYRWWLRPRGSGLIGPGGEAWRVGTVFKPLRQFSGALAVKKQCVWEKFVCTDRTHIYYRKNIIHWPLSPLFATQQYGGFPWQPLLWNCPFSLSKDRLSHKALFPATSGCWSGAGAFEFM